MDERLKKIINKTNLERENYEAKLNKEKEHARRIKENQDKKLRKEAKIWVELNIFNLIEKADRGCGYLYFTEHCSDIYNNYKSEIPAQFLIEEIKKIDGLNVEEYHNAELSDHDGPGHPAYYSYEVTWRPKKERNL